MSDFKDQVRQLLDTPGIRYGSADSAPSMIWFEHDTLPREEFGIDVASNTITRTTHSIADPPTNDTDIDFTIGTTTYTVILQMDGGAVTPPGSDHEVTAALTTAMTDAQRLSTIVAAMRVLPDITAKVISGTIVIFNDQNRALDVVASGSGVDSTSTASVTDSGLLFPPGYRPGDRWTKNQYLIVMQAWITGGDDTHYNVSVMCRADLQRMATDFADFAFPDDLAGDNFTIVYPYEGNSQEISWTYHMAEIGTFVRQAAGTAHPFYHDAFLIGIKTGVDKGTRTVTQIYKQVGPTAEQKQQGYTVEYECSSGAAYDDRYPLVTFRLDVLLESYVPAKPGDLCPIDGTNAGTLNNEINFSALKLRQPPVLENKGPVYGTMVAVYSRLPSWPKTRKRKVDFPENAEVFVTELYVEDSAYTQPDIDDAATTFAGAAYSNSYVTGVSEEPQGCDVSFIQIEHARVPADFTEWGSEGFRFPPLYPASVEFPPKPVPYPGGREAWSESVPVKLSFSFTRDPDSLASNMPESVRFESNLRMGVQAGLEAGLDEDEIAESISRVWWNQPHILHDTFFIEDPKRGVVVVAVSPSNPSSTLYRAWITAKALIVVRDVLRRWRGKIHMRIKAEVKAR